MDSEALAGTNDGTAAAAQDSSPVVAARRDGGMLLVTVTDPINPQSVSGVIFRFDAPGQPGVGVATFKTKRPTVEIGAASADDGKKFSVEGRVIAFGDSPPSPYEVVVTIEQDGQTLLRAIPSNGGSGTVGDADQPFEFSFRVRAQ